MAYEKLLYGVEEQVCTITLNRGWADRDSRVAMTLQEERAGVKVNTTAEAIREALGGVG